MHNKVCTVYHTRTNIKESPLLTIIAWFLIVIFDLFVLGLEFLKLVFTLHWFESKPLAGDTACNLLPQLQKKIQAKIKKILNKFETIIYSNQLFKSSESWQITASWYTLIKIANI